MSSVVEFEGCPRLLLSDSFGAPDVEDLRRCWADLLSGIARIVDGFSTDEAAYLALAPIEARRAGLGRRSVDILERVVLGESPKALAIDHEISISTVAAELKTALQRLGWTQSTSKLPLGLILLVRGAKGSVASRLCWDSGITRDGVACRVLRAPLPPLTRVLSPAVCQVVHLHAQGKSHLEIAARRRTSRRTVANQLAVAFRLLRVSGRGQLLHYLAASSP